MKAAALTTSPLFPPASSSPITAPHAARLRPRRRFPVLFLATFALARSFCLGCLSPLPPCGSTSVQPSRVSWALSPLPVSPPAHPELWSLCLHALLLLRYGAPVHGNSTVSSPRAASWGAPPGPTRGSSVLPAVKGGPVARVRGVFPDGERTSVCGCKAYRCMGLARQGFSRLFCSRIPLK